MWPLAYEAFWAKLRRGEYDTGVYRRLGKNDKEVWILASYSPVLDSEGRESREDPARTSPSSATARRSSRAV